MVPMHPELSELLALMEGGALVLTVNKRLSRRLVRAYERWMLARGVGAWDAPAVMPLVSWVMESWANAVGSKPVLPAHVSAALWRRIVESEAEGALTGVLLKSALATAAAAAYSLMAEYRATLPSDIYLTPEAAAFKRWSALYEEELGRLGFIDSSAAALGTARLIASKRVEVRPKVVFAGFDDFAPSTRAVVDALGGLLGQEGLLFWPKTGATAGRVRVVKCADMEEEVSRAARMARAAAAPGKTIAFIVPELERYVGVITREFSAELDPRSVLPWEEGAPVFNISLGAPLSEEPIVKAALDLLSITPAPFEAALVTRLFMTAFVAPDEKEREALGSFDLEARRDGLLELTPARLVAWLKAKPGANALAKRLDGWLAALKAGSKTLPSEWAARFSSVIDALGMRKNVALSSAEYQALEGFRTLLESFSSLDDALGPVTRDAALSELKELADGAIHRPESPESGVEVMGLLESAGLFFDAVRVLGAHEEALPRPSAPNPFIPVWLQRSLGMPRSSHELEAAFARKALARISGSAPLVEASWPAESDGKERRLSPLVAALAMEDGGGPESIAPSHRLADFLRNGVSLEDIDNFETIPVDATELARIRGGASILREVSACPFMAFASRRLRAEPLEEPGIGILPEERGTALHEAMKLFWSEVKDSARLKEAGSSGRLDGIIEASVDGALGPLKRPGSRAFVGVERARLIALMKEWMELEAKRSDFTVKELEAARTVTYGPLSITARIDRIDSSSDGDIVLDYKTGACSRKDWLGDRPGDPQLLLYFSTGEFDALSFASVRVDGVRFVGAARTDGALPGIKAFESDSRWRAQMEGVGSWEELRARWKATLERLADDFVSGRVRVDPNPLLKGRNSPCERCDYPALCRISERPDGVSSTGDEDDEEDRE